MTCNDWSPAINKPLSFRLNREKAGGASLEIDGEITPIASDAFESSLTKSTVTVNTGSGDGTLRKTEREKQQKEIEEFMRTDKGLVSDARLDEISRQLGISITVKK